MESSQCIWVAAVFHLFGSNQENDPVIKLIVGAGEVLVFLLILVACGYVVYLGIRLWDKERARKMVQRVMKSKRSEEHTSELQSPCNLVCRLLLEKKKKKIKIELSLSLIY